MPGSCRSSSDSSPRRQWLRVICLALFSLLLSSEAEATNVLTDWDDDPRKPTAGRRAFEIGATFSLPLPVAGASREVIGLNTGMSFTMKSGPSDGVGVGIAYHYLPISASMKRAFDTRLRESTWETLRTGDGTWGMEMVQYSFHVRAAGPGASGRWVWLQAGASLYRIDPNISGYSGDAGFFSVVAPPLALTSHVGGSFAVGADLFGGRRARLGVDATFHWVACEGSYGENLQVILLGANARFGW